MSQNVEVIRRSFDAVNRSDAEAIAALCDDDIEFLSQVMGDVEGGTIYRGKDSFEIYFGRMRETWAEFRIEDAEVFEADDERLVAVFRLVGTGKTSGARVEQTVGITYRFRDGKLWRIRSYLDPREALEAMGLKE